MAKLLKWNGLDIDPSKHTESTIVEPRILPENKLAFKEAKSKTGEKFILPRIEAIHAGTTRNFTRYLADKLKGDPLNHTGVYSWLYPFAKPVIYNHDTDTEATGRIHSAAFSKDTQAGKPGIIVIPKITDPVAIEKVLDERLLTVSIGATTDSAICTICGTDIIQEGFCGHMKGESYDGHIAEWIIGQVWFDELSWVNVPADQNAMVVDSGKVQTAEAFAQAGENFINLGQKSTEWILTHESAQMNGLVISEGQKGDLNVPTVEELQLQVEQLTADVLRVTTEKNQLETQLTEATATIGAKDTKISEMQTQLDTKDTALTDTVAAKDTAEAKIVELTTTVESLEVERDGMLNKNTELSAEMHKATAERVVDLKVILGKVTNREESIEQHVGRSMDSLKDSLADLLVEVTTFKPTRTTPADPISNPTSGAMLDGTEPNVLEGEKPLVKELTKEDALKSLFTGPGIAKRK